MTAYTSFILTATLALTACSSRQSENKFYTELTLNELDIPKHWTEIKKQGNEWVYFIPCHNVRELQTVDIYNAESTPRITCNFGTSAQWFIINKIHKQGDSLLFETALPFDTSGIVTFTMKYIDQERKISRWITDGVVCSYIPTADTSKYTRIAEPCD